MTNWEKWSIENLDYEEKRAIICRKYKDCEGCPFEGTDCDDKDIGVVLKWLNSEVEEKTFHVGDVVWANGFSLPVVVIALGQDLVSRKTTDVKCMNYLGDVSWKKVDEVHKTGKSIPQIKEVFRVLKERNYD